MKHERNELKRKALAIFENRGWLSVPAWAALAGYYPIRGAYTVLKRFYRWKLLKRRLDARGLILYRISDRGRARLAWLRQAREAVANPSRQVSAGGIKRLNYFQHREHKKWLHQK